ncbi:type II secretion system F family protein [Denitrificimonas sp. JX-1]|uniref:Type II secretion system F family protein n=1 Tax=Denitrificimonas halotolerans TaxID=3098930 RepID=A0ABU5GT43_9GAMM|nr:type II secretion system F family protein [Denitrificimonas sp. JX-1]MDY7219525.1 type II secretion system F family protein [Denitrificimonas sp. JX-1]
MLLLISAVLLLSAAGLLLYFYFQTQYRNRAIVQRLGQETGTARRELLRNFDEGGLAAHIKSLDAEVGQYLNIMGWRQAKQRSIFYLGQVAFTVACLGVAVIFVSTKGEGGLLLAVLFALAAGFLLPKMWLRKKAEARQANLVTEVSTLIPLLRSLFEVGLTVEQALRVITYEAQSILPEFTFELKWVLARVDAGLDLGSELRAVAELLDVEEVTDTFAILEQLITQGGGAMNSLLNLKNLVDERRLTALEELVSKLSAKMSMVMLTFLFPALLIVLAGPGFIAIIKALGDMG